MSTTVLGEHVRQGGGEDRGRGGGSGKRGEGETNITNYRGGYTKVGLLSGNRGRVVFNWEQFDHHHFVSIVFFFFFKSTEASS